MATYLLMLLVQYAVGAPPGFELLKVTGDCSYYFRDKGEGTAAMRAECEWQDVELLGMKALLARYEDYDDYVFPIQTSVVREVTDARSLVFQQHQVFWFAPREALIWMEEQQDEESYQVNWVLASDRTFQLSKGAVPMALNEGYWRVVSLPTGGVGVEHQVQVDAGPGLPDWLVSFFRTRGFIRVMRHVRELGKSQQQD